MRREDDALPMFVGGVYDGVTPYISAQARSRRES
jgi:hypothetical protein